MTRFFFPTLLCDSLTIRRCWLGNCECVGDEFFRRKSVTTRGNSTDVCNNVFVHVSTSADFGPPIFLFFYSPHEFKKKFKKKSIYNRRGLILLSVNSCNCV